MLIHILFFLMKVSFNKLIYFHVVDIESPILYQSSKREDSWYFFYKHYEWQYSCIQLYKNYFQVHEDFFNSDNIFKQWRHMCIDWVGNKSLMELCSETTLKENIACTKLQSILQKWSHKKTHRLEPWSHARSFSGAFGNRRKREMHKCAHFC